MKALAPLTAILFFTLSSKAVAQTPTAEARSILESSKQLLVVTTPAWDSVRGELRCFFRDQSDEPWQEVRHIPIVVGKKGMSWGKGVLTNPTDAEPVKLEGNGRAPAGMFRLGRLFGYKPLNELTGISYPYIQVTADYKCVDDSKSMYYNLIVRQDTVAKVDWNSAENMVLSDDQYRLGLEVYHNPSREPMGGSCIFFHIWSGPGNGTAGCTAMSAEDMEWLAHWLKPEAAPFVVQFPESEYAKFAAGNGLPHLHAKM